MESGDSPPTIDTAKCPPQSQLLWLFFRFLFLLAWTAALSCLLLMNWFMTYMQLTWKGGPL